MVSFQVIGNDTAVAYAVQAGQLELNVMMPTMAYNVLQSITILGNMLRQLDVYCVRGIMANEARCQTYAQSTVSLATALNPIYRVCQGGRDCEGVGGYRKVNHRDCALPGSCSPKKRLRRSWILSG